MNLPQKLKEQEEKRKINKKLNQKEATFRLLTIMFLCELCAFAVMDCISRFNYCYAGYATFRGVSC